jgi:hypothetical protein
LVFVTAGNLKLARAAVIAWPAIGMGNGWNYQSVDE